MNSVAMLGETLFAATLMMLLVLVVRRPVARRFGAPSAYALWILPVLRMFLPPLPYFQSPLAMLLTQVPELATPLASATGDAGPMAPGPASFAAVETAATLPWPTLVIGLWLAGAALWAGWQVWRYHRFLAGALCDAELLSYHQGIAVLVSPAVAGPMATGIWRRRIFLPVDFRDRYTSSECRLALLHEGAHHDRGDIIANVLGLVVLAAHWWNPVAHFAWAAFRVDQELACDATVLGNSNAAERHDYGRAVLKSACARIPTAACAMNTKSQLKERIAMMKSTNRTPWQRLAGVAIGGSIVAGGLALSAAAAPPAAPAPAIVPAAPVPPAAAAMPMVPTAPPERRIRTIIIKDGKVVENRDDRQTIVMVPHNGDGKARDELPADLSELEMLEALAVSVADRETTGARPRVIISCKRRLGPGGVADGGTLATADDCQALKLAAATPPVRDSLLAARKSVETTPGLSADQRQAALAGIDKAMAEAEKRPNGK